MEKPKSKVFIKKKRVPDLIVQTENYSLKLYNRKEYISK